MPVTPPVPTSPGVPAGFKMDDGYQALITLAVSTTISLWPLTVQPPSLDGGEAIPTTTMLNTKLKTFSPQALITMLASPVQCGYDPRLFNQVLASSIINKPTTITITFMEGSTLAYYGWLQKVDFGPLAIGAFPSCTATLFPSNQDLAGFEASYVFTLGPGTFNR